MMNKNENKGLKYLHGILSNKLHNQKFDYNSNEYFIIQLSVEQAWNIVMEICEVENIMYENKCLMRENESLKEELENVK